MYLSAEGPTRSLRDVPDGDGIAVTESIREWSEMPILVLSAVGEEAEKIRALDAGADDYVTKPFGPGELVARLNAVINDSLKSPDMQATLAKFGSEANITSPQDFAAFIAGETKKWGDVARAARVQID